MTYTREDAITAEKLADNREREIDSLTANQFGEIPDGQLADMLDSLADRLFDSTHRNHFLVTEAALRIREVLARDG